MIDASPHTTLLAEFGLKEREVRVYLACLKLGQSTVGAISDEAGVQRTFVYDILEDMSEKGLVSGVEVRGKKTFSAISIEGFKNLQETKMRRLREALPELKMFEQSLGDRPVVRFYEGKEGIFNVQQETLTMARGSEILAYATAEGLYKDDPEFALRHIRARVKKGIFSRALAADTPDMHQFTDLDAEHMRTTRLVPGDRFPFTNEINIWHNKVSIMSMQGQLLAVVIESETVAKMQRSIFELAWRGAAEFNRSI